MLQTMASVEDVVHEAGLIRVTLEAVERIAAKLDNPELTKALKAHHDQLQSDWQLAKEHFGIPPQLLSPGGDKPPRPNFAEPPEPEAA